MPDKREGDKSKLPEKSRLKRLHDTRGEDYRPEMPPVQCGDHVLDLLWTLGPTLSTTGGEGPLTHSELRHYQDNTGVELTEWEASILIRLSREYLGESHRATKRDCKAPWACPEQEAAIRVSVGMDMEAEMDSEIDE